MKGMRFIALFSWIVFLSACGANMQAGSGVAQGRQAMFRGDNTAALGYFQSAAQADPNYVYGGELREGVLSFLGRGQYLTGNFAQARQTLEQALSQHKSDNVARLYLGLAMAREGDRPGGLKNIDAGLKGINNFLNYIIQNPSQGQFWDLDGGIRKAIGGALATISSGNIDWQKLIADVEWIGKKIEEEPDVAQRLEVQDMQNRLRGFR